MYLGESFDAIIEEHEIDSIDYDEAMSDVDVHLWKKAIKVELESIYSNQVWELIEALEGIKPIWCKCVYKRNRGVDAKVENLKLGFSKGL